MSCGKMNAEFNVFCDNLCMLYTERSEKTPEGEKKEEKKKVEGETKGKILGKLLWAFVSHQCCLLDSFHCSRSDSKNAVRAKTPCSRLGGTLCRPPGH